ncbi:PPR domain-containing protein/PPR_1 domain-containing protein/PPR_2 domain-containing protein, partial [Cephalotus follicularis]
NAISWTALISGYVSNGRLEQAIRSIAWMQQEGFRPDVVTVATVLPVCGELRALKHGKEIHAYTVKNWFLPNVSLTTSLMIMYSKCAVLEYSVKLFDGMDQRNVISWTAMIDSYVENGHLIESVDVFRSMQLSKHRPDSVAMGRMLSICDPLLAKEIFDYASRQPGFRHSYASYIILILKLGRSNYFSQVDNLLIRLKSDHFPVTPTLFTYLIRIYAEVNKPDKALKTFHTMLEFSCIPLPKHLNRILEIAVSHRNYLRPAFDLFKKAHRYGVLPNTKSYNILMRAFCFNGDLSVAYQLFNQMFKRDVVPDIESYRVLMQGLCRKSQVNTAIDLFEDMLNKGYVPDSLSYTTLLNSLCRKKKLREAYKLLCRMKVKGCNPDIVHYNTVILGICREERAMDACKVLEDMEANGCLPNLVSYRTLVGGLCDQGLLDEAKKYMVEMLSKGFAPHFSISHSLIKGFCNVGRIEEACGVLGEVLKY